MQCWQCGATVRQGAKLCVYCGAKLANDDAGYERESDAPGRGSSDSRRRTPGREREEWRSPREPGYRSSRSSADTPDQYDVPDRHDLPQYEDPRSRPERRGREDAPRARYREEQPEEEYYRPADRDDQARRQRGSRGEPLNDPRVPRAARAAPPTPPRPRGRQEWGHEDERPATRRSQRAAEDELDAPRPARDPRAGERAPDEGDYGNYGRKPGRDRRVSASPARRAWDAEPDERFGNAENAEYSANYDARDGSAGRGAGRGSRPESRRYAEPDYRSEPDPRGWNQNDGYLDRRGRAQHDDVPPPDSEEMPVSRRPRPADDSWGMPALPAAQVPPENWMGGRGGPPPIGTPDARQSFGQRWQEDTAERASTAGSPPKRRRRTWIFAIDALFAVAIIATGLLKGPDLIKHFIGGGGATSNAHPFATYTPGPTPTVLAGYKQFASTRSAYVLNYPQQWNVDSKDLSSKSLYDYVDTFSQANAQVSIEQAQAFASVSDIDVIQAEVRGGQQQGTTFTQTGGTTTAQIGGEQWTRQEYDVMKNGVALHVAILSGHHQGRGYAILLLSQAANFAQLNQADFQPILNTFRFTA